MRKILGCVLALLLLLGATAAQADTYAVVVNALDVPINVGGAPAQPMAGTWTPLDATIVLPGGIQGKIIDMHVNGGNCWMLQATASLATTYCIPLAFAEVGCIAAIVSNTNAGKGAPIYRIDMTKMPGTHCSNNWWQTGGKELIFKAADVMQTQQSNATAALGLLVGK